ncbi:17458_t:CDS:1, partial [Funneliformis geosporum]
MSKNSDHNDDEINNIDPIDSFVISPNMKLIVTHHTNDSLTIWDVDIDAKTVKIVKLEEDKKFYKVIGISNDKLIIYLCSDSSDIHGICYYIRNIETSEEIPIDKIPYFFLPNGDILSCDDIYTYVFLKAFLKSSKISSNIRVNMGNLLDVNRQVRKNEIFFFQNDCVLYQLNTKTMKIDNRYDIPYNHRIIEYFQDFQVT